MQMLGDLNTFLNKAVPDTKLTIRKYADAKFEYLVSTMNITWGNNLYPLHWHLRSLLFSLVLLP